MIAYNISNKIWQAWREIPFIPNYKAIKNGSLSVKRCATNNNKGEIEWTGKWW